MSKTQALSLNAWWRHELASGRIKKERDLLWLMRDAARGLDDAAAAELFDLVWSFWSRHAG